MNSWQEEALAMYSMGANYSEIANRTGKNSECIRAYIRRHSPEFEGMKRIKVKPNEPDMPPESAEEDTDILIQQMKAKLVEGNQKRIISDLVKKTAQMEIITDKMISAIESLPRLEIIPIHAEITAKKTPEEIVLQISDIQAGTYISKEATGGLNSYGWDVLVNQFSRLEKAMISIITRQKMIAPIRKLNIHMLGDLVEGIDIFIGQAQHVDQDVYNQMFKLCELLSKFIVGMLYLFDEIEISCIGGNHGRIGKKGENPHYINWDVLLYKYMESKTQNYSDRIKWNVPLSWWHLDTIYGYKFLLLHGDDIKSWNGMPYYAIDRADAKWTQLLKSIGEHYDYMELGHFHSATELSGVTTEKFVNGCWPGGSIFSLKALMTSGRPRQNMFAVHPEHGVTWRYPIWLDQPV